MVRGYDDSAAGKDDGGLTGEVGELYAKTEETCEEGDTTLGLSAGVDAGLLSVLTD
jgi:hypothetical protein